MTKKPLDIKSLTATLKDRVNIDGTEKHQTFSDGEKLYTKPSSQKMTKRRNPDIPKTKRTDPEVGRLLDIMDKVNEKQYEKLDRFIYVDADIHEVFLKLKTESKLKISHLASYLLEEFIREHQKAIVEVLSKKTNKFLDR